MTRRCQSPKSTAPQREKSRQRKGRGSILLSMKLMTNLAGIILGLIFNVVAFNFFFHFFAMPEPPTGSPPALFLGAMISTGYFNVVKVLEITGGLCVIFPRTRPLGLLLLGPVVVNILCFHIFLMKGEGIFPLPTLVALLSLFLLWRNRSAFASLLSRGR